MTMAAVIALDIGGTNTRIALVKKGQISRYIKIKTPHTKKKFLHLIRNEIQKANSSEVSAIAVSIAGPLKDGIIKNPPNLPLKNFNLKHYLFTHFKKKIEVENDANCAALAELRYGCKKKNFVVMTFGTGVGGGVIIEGKLYTGEGYASELGHMIIHNGKNLEYWWKLQRRKNIPQKIKNDSIQHVAEGIASVINIFDPEIIVIAGGIRKNSPTYLEAIKRKVYPFVILPKKTPIAFSKLDHPGILGASLLIKD